jgi:hypothetical protein
MLGQIQKITFARIGQVHTETFNCGSDNWNHACENPSIAENGQEVFPVTLRERHVKDLA